MLQNRKWGWGGGGLQNDNIYNQLYTMLWKMFTGCESNISSITHYKFPTIYYVMKNV